jgi:hypothetical protein
VGILKYAFNGKWSIAGRVEHYNDKHGIIIATGTTNGFQTTGYSLNMDHAFSKNILIRLEARHLGSKDAIFIKQSQTVNKNTVLVGSISVSF